MLIYEQTAQQSYSSLLTLRTQVDEATTRRSKTVPALQVAVLEQAPEEEVTPAKDRLGKTLTRDEVRTFLSAIKSPRDRAIFTVMYWRGLRASEVGRIPLSAWDRRAGRLYVTRAKNSEPGEYALAPDERSALATWLRVRGHAPGPLFLSRGRRGISRQRVFELYRAYAQASGLPSHLQHPHCMKHSICAHLLGGGADVLDVKAWLGFANVSSASIHQTEPNPEQRDQLAATIYNAAAPRESKDSCVYFIETCDGEYMKIGYSANPSVRFRNLEDTMRPTPIRLIGYIPGTRATESWLHRKFAHLRERGEWFRKSEEIICFLEAIGPLPL